MAVQGNGRIGVMSGTGVIVIGARIILLSVAALVGIQVNS
jgi:hypothetical protein